MDQYHCEGCDNKSRDSIPRGSCTLCKITICNSCCWGYGAYPDLVCNACYNRNVFDSAYGFNIPVPYDHNSVVDISDSDIKHFEEDDDLIIEGITKAGILEQLKWIAIKDVTELFKWLVDKISYETPYLEPYDRDLHSFLTSLEPKGYFYTVYDVYFNSGDSRIRTTSVNIYKNDPDLKNMGIDDEHAKKFAHRIVKTNSGLKPFTQRTSPFSNLRINTNVDRS